MNDELGASGGAAVQKNRELEVSQTERVFNVGAELAMDAN
jgi:hypothetical protein